MGDSPTNMPGVLESARFRPVTDTEVLPADLAAELSRDAPQAHGLANLLDTVCSFPVMLGTLLVGAVFVAGRVFAVDPDLWWHIKNGQNILGTHHWPTSDPFSFTVANTPWLSYEWLGDVLLGLAQRFGGLQGLDGLLILLGSAIMLALYGYASLRSGNSKAGFVTVAVLYALVTPSFTLRPQMFGYLFIILGLIAVERFRQGHTRSLWALPPLFLVWINTHGSWIIGLGMLTVFLLCGIRAFRLGGITSCRWNQTQRMQLELCLLLCLAVIPVTPYGTRLAAYPFTVASALPVNIAQVLEWQPMPFNLPGGKLFLVLLLGFFLLQMALQFTCRLDELALFIGGTVMACLHFRFVLLFVPFFSILLVTVLARWIPSYDPRKDRRVLNATLMVAVMACVVWFFPTRAELRAAISRRFPVRAVDYLRQHAVPRPLYNTYGYGGYLIWALPERKVFIDGRGDLYELGGAFSDYLEIATLRPAAFAVLRFYGIRSCLLERSEPLATVLAADPDWQQEYSDEVSVLFVKREAANSLASARQPHAGQEE